VAIVERSEMADEEAEGNSDSVVRSRSSEVSHLFGRHMAAFYGCGISFLLVRTKQDPVLPWTRKGVLDGEDEKSKRYTRIKRRLY